MIDPDELQDELEAEQEFIEKLIIRSKQQEKDINELQDELDRFKEDLEAQEEPISPEEWGDHLSSGVAQS